MLDRLTGFFDRIHLGATVKLAAPGFLSIPITLFAVPVCLSTLGVAGYGQLLIMFLLINQSHVLLLGADKNLIRRLVQSDAHSEDISAAGLLAVIYGAMIAAIIVTIDHYFSVADTLSLRTTTIILLALGLPLHFLWSVQRSILQARERFSALGTATFIYMAAVQYMPLLVIFLLPSGATVTGFLCATLMARCVLSIWLLWSINESLSRFSLRNIRNVLQLVSYGKWIGINQTVQMIFDGADRYLLGLLASPAAVALYAVPLQTAQKLAGLPVAMAQIVFNRSVTTDHKRSENYLSDLLTLAPLGAAIFFSICELFFTLWLQSHYVPLILVLGVMTFLAITFTSLNFVATSILESSGQARRLAAFDGAALLPLICLMAYLTYLYGAVGTASALILKEFIFLVTRFILIRPSFLIVAKAGLASLILVASAVAAVTISSAAALVGAQIIVVILWLLILACLRRFHNF